MEYYLAKNKKEEEKEKNRVFLRGKMGKNFKDIIQSQKPDSEGTYDILLFI